MPSIELIQTAERSGKLGKLHYGLEFAFETWAKANPEKAVVLAKRYGNPAKARQGMTDQVEALDTYKVFRNEMPAETVMAKISAFMEPLCAAVLDGMSVIEDKLSPVENRLGEGRMGRPPSAYAEPKPSSDPLPADLGPAPAAACAVPVKRGPGRPKRTEVEAQRAAAAEKAAVQP
jgi:hypothetical protein